ncbi:MlaA family lipoprotein [Crenalkalicoccus roseus]|uniref:MlaA family lipoprotein n=1 Tax=Crenalkalicoccus roseus TaxID=1485588 RepID=UPI001080720B|nr:VacJ family lipoprotein [Crenalkalicoccus roseus]
MSPSPLLVALSLVAVLATGCATRPPAGDPEALAEFRETNDPAEPFNRAMYDVHQGLDRAVLRPVARGYRTVVPQPVRTGVRNVLGNLRSPVILLNDMLQGEPRRAGDTLGRFVINSTLGLGGIFDVAKSHFGVPGHTADFGQTLGRWGVGEGPYLFVPVLGPSNPRDLLGFGAGVAADPFFWVGQGAVVDGLAWGRVGATVVDTREDLLDPLDELERSSLDPYATLRSVYRQRRRAMIELRPGAEAPAGYGTGFGIGTGQDQGR